MGYNFSLDGLSNCLFYLYWRICGINLIGEYIISFPGKGGKERKYTRIGLLMRYSTKPLFVPLLILQYKYSVEEMSKIMLIALIFAWIGDINFMKLNPKPRQIPVQIGMLLFFIAHLGYIYHFYCLLQGVIGNILYIYNIYTLIIHSLPSLLFFFSLWVFLINKLDKKESKIPITFSMSVLALLLFITTFLPQLHFTGGVTIFIGTSLFLISSVFVAILIFADYCKQGIMIPIIFTYVLAQYLIIQGLILIPAIIA